MAKKAPASFDFFPEDWLTSPRVLAMLPEQEGAYIHLLAIIANTASCCIAGDDQSLATSSRLHARWKRLGAAVRDCFTACPEHPERITNEKLWEIRQERIAFATERRESGARGAAGRWGTRRGAMAQPSPVTDGSAIHSASGSASGSADGSTMALSPHSSQKKKTSLIAPGFPEFWAAYPRKVDKADAEHAWAKLAPSEALREQIMAGLAALTPQYLRRIERGEREYVPHASTWLNKRRWEDEPEPTGPEHRTAAERPFVC